MPLVLIVLAGVAIAVYLYAGDAQASFAPGDDLAPDPVAPDLPNVDVPGNDFLSGLLSSMGGAVSRAARGIRNNNPGNIRAGDAWQGATGDDGAFVTFATPDDGIRALAVTLRNYQDRYQLNTVRQIINRWAPPNENNTAAYIASVAMQLGVTPDQALDLHDAATLARLADAIITHENGSNPYTRETVAAGVARALS